MCKGRRNITAVAGVEGLLNSQPLTYQSADPRDVVPLTLNHFLHGQLGGQVAPETVGKESRRLYPRFGSVGYRSTFLCWTDDQSGQKLWKIWRGMTSCWSWSQICPDDNGLWGALAKPNQGGMGTLELPKCSVEWELLWGPSTNFSLYKKARKMSIDYEKWKELVVVEFWEF